MNGPAEWDRYCEEQQAATDAMHERFIRRQYALAALTGFCAAPQTSDLQSDKDRCERAWEIADRMMRLEYAK